MTLKGKRVKVYFIKLLIHIPFLRKYAWRMYANILANVFADSVNRAEEIKKQDYSNNPAYEMFPAIQAIEYTLAMLPAALIAYHVGLLTNEPDWLVKHLRSKS